MGPFGHNENLVKTLGPLVPHIPHTYPDQGTGEHLSTPDQEISHHLFLSRDALLVSLPPGWVMQVVECLVPRCDTRRAKKLRRPKEADQAAYPGALALTTR